MKYYIAGNRGLVGTHYSNVVSNSLGGNTATVDYSDSTSTYEESKMTTPCSPVSATTGERNSLATS